MALTQKQEAFCLAYIETGNATNAYKQAYSVENMKPESINVEASKLLNSPKISQRIEELRQPVICSLQYALSQHLSRLDILSRKAEEAGQFSVAVNAEIARGKAMGLYAKSEESAQVIFGNREQEIKKIADPNGYKLEQLMSFDVGNFKFLSEE
ncbi:terminase small subunit [Testudinibacter sp. P27/CKL/0425]